MKLDIRIFCVWIFNMNYLQRIEMKVGSKLSKKVRKKRGLKTANQKNAFRLLALDGLIYKHIYLMIIRIMYIIKSIKFK
jgi:hypothetical protein